MSILTRLKGKSLGKRRNTLCEEAKIYVQVHFVREKSSKRYKFNTLKLKNDALRDACTNWYIQHDNPTNFFEIVFLYLEERKISPKAIATKYGIDENIFHETNSSTYPIAKWEAVSVCLGLKLNIAQTRALLKTVDYALTNSIESDLILRFCFENEIYDKNDVNFILQQLTSLKLEEIQ